MTIKLQLKKMALQDYAGAIIGGANLISSTLGLGNKQQVKQQDRLNKINEQSNKRMADYEQELKMKMWQDTNYTAQLKEAEKAGVSKAAVLGGGGPGTGQGASVSSVSGTGAANSAEQQRANTENAMAIAQIANLNADTKKKEVEAGKIGGADTENTIADTAVKKATAKIQEVAARVANDTEQDQIKAITYATNEQVEKAREQFHKAQVAEEGQQAEIAKIKSAAISEGLNAILIENQIGKTRAETRKITEEIKQNWQKVAQGWKGLNLQEKSIKLQEFKTEIEAQYPNVWNVAGRAIDDMITEIVTLGGKLGERHKTKQIK